MPKGGVVSAFLGEHHLLINRQENKLIRVL